MSSKIQVFPIKRKYLLQGDAQFQSFPVKHQKKFWLIQQQHNNYNINYTDPKTGSDVFRVVSNQRSGVGCFCARIVEMHPTHIVLFLRPLKAKGFLTFLANIGLKWVKFFGPFPDLEKVCKQERKLASTFLMSQIMFWSRLGSIADRFEDDYPDIRFYMNIVFFSSCRYKVKKHEQKQRWL